MCTDEKDAALHAGLPFLRSSSSWYNLSLCVLLRKILVYKLGPYARRAWMSFRLVTNDVEWK